MCRCCAYCYGRPWEEPEFYGPPPRGFGRGRGRRYLLELEEEREMLERRLKRVEDELEELRKKATPTTGET